MSTINSLFNRATFGTRCKTCLNLAISRIKLLHNRRELQLKHMRKEIAEYLQNGQEAIARIKVEHVICEQNVAESYEILELFCEQLIARIPIIEAQRDCPVELLEAVATIIFASPRCSDLPELLQVRNLLTTKYGKEFVSAAAELRPDSCVNRLVIEKLSVGAPSVERRLDVLKEISEEYNLRWDSTSTEKEFSKKHEDLLDGSIPITNKPSSIKAGPTEPTLPSPKTTSGRDRVHGIDETRASNSSSDAMERAQAALAVAERALASAHAAAELTKVKLFSQGSKAKHFG
ncbi:hypothetical protein HPP92_003777 [Vanilla planifolia]|uniref:IST1-like protein n=1 Tax=Vanilla planifolia TaxID=51239 RepID=A0A835RVI4_VANPL|nr:hypothetical protein HPP92_003777 [Vanilla planifolia]